MRKYYINRYIALVIIAILLISSFGITVGKPQSIQNSVIEQSQQDRGVDYWIQTTDEDFNAGTKYNINVSNDAFHLNETIYKSNKTILDLESFEEEWPPKDWTKTGAWNKESNRAHTGKFSADFDGFFIGTSGVLVTPSMDTSHTSVIAIYVEFWGFSEEADKGEYYLDYFDGSLWNEITRLDNFGQGRWAVYHKKITNSTYFIENFQIRWRVVGLDFAEHVYVDDVKVILEFQMDGFVTHGSLISQTHDTEVEEPVYKNLTIDSNIPSGTTVESWLRTAETESGLESAIWYSNITLVPHLQWAQWRINLTGNEISTPTVYEVNLSWHYEDLPVPELTFVDDDFDESTPGWGYDHFDNIQDGVNAVNISGTVNIYSGTYSENVVINRSMTLIGEDEYSTIVDGNLVGSVISISNSVVSISGLTVHNSGSTIANAGIIVTSSEIIFSSLIIQNNYNGIILLNTENSEIYLSTITGNSFSGIALEINSNNNLIAGNTISNNNIGIYLNNTFDNEISKYNDGIKEHWNEIENNDYGIYSLENSINNNIYYNNLQENDQNAIDLGTNIWDDGQRGNYWDDYTGEDANGDGIGDTPYPIPGGSNQDNYPLMSPNGYDLVPPEIFLTKPVDNYLYINIRDIVVIQFPLHLIFINSLIIGKIEIEVEAFDNLSGINKVEFYINNELKSIVESEPYNWMWDEKVALAAYTIKVTAYDNAGNQDSDMRVVWRIG